MTESQTRFRWKTPTLLRRQGMGYRSSRVFFTSYMSYLAVVVRIYRVLEGSSSLLCFVFVFYVWEKTQTR
jgi:hypothetical protein